MKPRHMGVAVLIAAIWGVNFVVIDVGLGSLPPLLFAGLRFVAAAFPAVLFVRRPAIPWRWFALVGLPLMRTCALIRAAGLDPLGSAG